MANTIRIKRRTYTSGGSTDAPTSLALGELAYNDNSRTLYIGAGASGGDTIHAVAGEGLNYVTLNTDQSITGVKTFTSLINADAGIAVDTNKFTVADGTGNTTIAGTLEVTGTIKGGLAADNADRDAFVVSHSGVLKTRTGSQVLSDIGAQPLNALLTDLSEIGATSTGANQFIVSTATGTFAIESGNTVRTSIGLGTGGSPVFTGLTLSGDLAVDGGDITSNAGTFNFLTDLASVEVLNIGHSSGTLGTTFPGTVDIDAGLNVGETNQFAVSSAGAITGNLAADNADRDAFVVSHDGLLKTRTGAQTLTDIGGAPAAGSTNITTLGTIATGTWGATDIAVLHGGTGASTKAGARTNLEVDAAGTDNSTNVTLASGSKDYITLSGQALTINQIDLTDDVTGTLPAAKVGVLPTSKITTGTFHDDRIKASNVTQHQASITALGTLTGLTVSGNVDMQSSLDVNGTLDVKTGDLYITSGALIGPSTFYIDPAPNDSPHNNNSPAATGKVIIRGDLQVDGTTTTINSTEISITDKQMVLADNQTAYAGLSGSGLLLGDSGTAGQGLVEFQYVNASQDKDKRMELTGANGAGTDIGLHISGGLYNTVVDGGTF